MDIDEQVFTEYDYNKLNNYTLVVIPDNFTKIDDSTFNCCYNLIEVVLPSKLIEIGEDCFQHCNSLEKINLPPILKKIGSYAFWGCVNLEEIIIPKDVTRIEPGTFMHCTRLKDIKLPENLSFIGDLAFYNCSLTKIVIPDKVHTIGSKAFEQCANLKEIELPKNLKNVDFCIFQDCPIKKISMYANNNLDFINCISRIFMDLNYELNFSKKIELIIKYDNYEELYGFTIILIDKLYNIILKRNLKIDISFIGKKLTFIERMKLKSKIFNIINKISFKEENIEETKNEVVAPKLNDEIKKLLEDIKNISSKLSTETKNIIDEKVTKLLDTYYKEIMSHEENSRPSLNLAKKEDIDLKLEEHIDPEVVLLISLKNIKLSLSSHEKLLSDLSNVCKCKEILKTKVDKIPDEINTLEEIVKSIIYFTSKIDNEKKEYFINLVTNYLDNAERKYRKNLDNLFNEDNGLVIFEDFDTDKELKINLLNTLDDLMVYSRKVLPFLELLEAINSIPVNSCIVGDDIKDTIITVKYLISLIENKKNKEQLESEFSEFCIRYMFRIENILTNYNDIKDGDYQKLEIEIAKEIQPILEKLDLYSNKDKNEKDILIQLSNSIDILNNNEIVQINKKKIIESWIAELHNRIINNNQILPTEKKEIKEKLLNIINTWIDKINKITSEDNMDNVIQDILKDIADVHINLEMFLTDLSKFNSKSKKLQNN